MFFEGQRVICVDASPYWKTGQPTGLVLNARYTIECVNEFPYNNTVYYFVTLHELPSEGWHLGFRVDRFRPATDISELKKLLATKSVDEFEKDRV